MKFNFILTLFLAGAAAAPAFAQGYRDGIEYYKADRIAQAEELLLRNLNNADTDKAASYFYLGQICIDRFNHSVRLGQTDASNLQNAAKYFADGIKANPEYPFNYVGEGQLALMNGDSKAAEDKFKQANKLSKKDAGVPTAIARAYYSVDPNLYAKPMNKYLNEAKKLVVNRVTSGKKEFKENDADYYMLEGDILFNSANGDSRQVGDACNMYEQAIGIDPTTGEGYVKYADSFFTIKRNDYALSKLEEMLANNPQSALGQREYAEKLYSDGQIARATEMYGKLLQNPNHFAADETRYLTLLYFNKDYQSGYDQATKMLNADGKNFTARRFQYIFANLLGKDNTLPLAEALLANKSAENKFATGDYSMIAGDLIKAGRLDDGIKVLEMGAKDYPTESSMLKGASEAYRGAGLYDKAADSMVEYIAREEKTEKGANGSDLWTLSNYALVAGNTPDNPENMAKYWAIAKEAARKSLDKLAPESKYMAAKRMGDVERYSKNEEGAVENYKAAIQYMEEANVTDDPQAAKDMLRFVTVSYYTKKDYVNAKIYFDKFLIVEPNDADMNTLKAVLN